MIIKSMSRKDGSFGQLLEYMMDIDKADEKFNVYHNLYSRKSADIEQEFRENAAFMPKRKNGNQMYHEILSIKKAQILDSKEQKRQLHDIAQEYLARRASANLAFGVLHDDHEEHLHYHLLISANACRDSKRTRLSKAQFSEVKKELELHVLSRYSQLGQEVVINRKANEKLSSKGAERKRRTGELPERDRVKQALESMFSQCETKEAFFTALSKEDLALYTRGNAIGVRNTTTNRKHRLKSLGVLDQFHHMSKKIELAHATKQKNIKDTKVRKTERHAQSEQGKRASEAQTMRQSQSNSGGSRDSHSEK